MESFNTGENKYDHVQFIGHYINSLSPVASMVNSNSRTFYHLTANQITVNPDHYQETPEHVFKNDVLEAIKYVRQNYTSFIKIDDWYITPITSGSWFGDPKSEYYNADELNFVNSWNNQLLTGFWKNNMIQFIIFYKEKDFILTKDMVAYRLGQKLALDKILTK